ncbi:MAG: response regulator [Planctomycetes bacterium]|nr:response regulator [Planctomycetota bacterium]
MPESPRILIVDDSATMRVKLSVHFRERGWRSLPCGNPAEALALLVRGGVNLIISDVDMPQMDGITFLRTVKADPRTAPLPFVMYSAVFEVPAWADQAYAAGAAVCLLKPMEPTRLLDEVLAVLEGRASQRGTAVVAAAPRNGEPTVNTLPGSRPAGESAQAVELRPPLPPDVSPAPPVENLPPPAAPVAGAPASTSVDAAASDAPRVEAVDIAALEPALLETLEDHEAFVLARERDLRERIATGLSGAACVLDPRGAIRTVMGCFDAWFSGGRSAEGRPFADVVPLRSREDGAGPSAWVKPAPESRRFRAGVWAQDGRWMEFDVSTAGVAGEPGQPPDTLVVLRDRTFERRVEEERREAEMLVTALGAGVLTLDVTGRVLRANALFAVQFGYTAEELVGRSGRPFWGPPGTPHSYEAIFRSALSKGFDGVVAAQRRDGTSLRLQLKAVAILGEQDVPVGTLWITRPEAGGT